MKPADEIDKNLGRAWDSSKLQTVILWVISGLFLTALVFKLFFTISGISFSVEPPSLFPDGESTVTVRAVAKNTVGFKIPYRRVMVFYQIVEGSDRVDIIGGSKNSVTLRAKRETGDVILKARLSGDVIPYEIIIPILPLYASN